MVALLRRLGTDFVLNAISLLICYFGEASELIERITMGTKPLPQFAVVALRG